MSQRRNAKVNAAFVLMLFGACLVAAIMFCVRQ